MFSDAAMDWSALQQPAPIHHPDREDISMQPPPYSLRDPMLGQQPPAYTPSEQQQQQQQQDHRKYSQPQRPPASHSPTIPAHRSYRPHHGSRSSALSSRALAAAAAAYDPVLPHHPSAPPAQRSSTQQDLELALDSSPLSTWWTRKLSTCPRVQMVLIMMALIATVALTGWGATVHWGGA